MTDVPLFTTPVVGYRRWKMGWTNGENSAQYLPDGTDPEVADMCNAVPALMPHGWQSTGEPWVPGRNDAVCSGIDAYPPRTAYPPHGTGAYPFVNAAGITAGHFEPTRGVKPPHAAPDPDCGCGLYAMHTIEEALQVRGPLREDEVLGAVVGWGAIEVHADGWRAEHAMVVGLSVDGYEIRSLHLYATEEAGTRHRNNVRLLAKRYGVPAVALPDLHLIAEGHGQPLPDAAKPKKSVPETPKAYWPSAPAGHSHSSQSYHLIQAEQDLAQYQRRMERLWDANHQRPWPPFHVWLARRIRRALRIPPRRPGWADLGV